MKFGLLYEMEMHPELGSSESDVYWQAIEQVKLAEEVGFDYVWCVEHHFLEGFSHSSAPEIFLTAVAQHTSRIRIGHGVVLLPIPFNHPARVAERTATLDILCKGRLDVGTGRYWQASQRGEVRQGRLDSGRRPAQGRTSGAPS